MKRIVCALILLLTVLSFTAAETDSPSDKPGKWREWVPDDTRRSGSRNPRQPDTSGLQDIYDRIGAMAEIFRAAPALSTPAGFEIKGSRKVNLTMPRWAGGNPAGAGVELNLYLYPYYRSGGKIKVSNVNYTGHIMLYGNDPAPVSLFGPGVPSLEGEPWFLEPVREGTVGRFPLYRAEADARTKYRGPHRFILISGPGCPPLWLPVSTEEYINDLIRRQETALAAQRRKASQLPSGAQMQENIIKSLEKSIEMQIEMFPEKREELLAQKAELIKEFAANSRDREQYDQIREAAGAQHDKMEESITELKAQLAAMPPSERKAQAQATLNFRLPDTPGSTYLMPPGTPGGTEPRGVVRINPAVFGQNTPVTAVRFLIVSLYADGTEMTDRMDAITRELDWEALARLVE